MVYAHPRLVHGLELVLQIKDPIPGSDSPAEGSFSACDRQRQRLFLD